MNKRHGLIIACMLLGLALEGVAQGTALPALDFQKKITSTLQAQLVDVRTPDEFKDGHIKGARNIDWLGGSFEKEAATLDKTMPVFVYCLSGPRSSAAAKRLRSLGFKEVYDLQGGINRWQAAKLPLTKE